MPEERFPLNEDLKAVEARLAALSPAAGGLDRDRLMYEAGRASAGHLGSGRLWPASAIAMTMVSAILATALFVQTRTAPQSPIGVPAHDIAATPMPQSDADPVDAPVEEPLVAPSGDGFSYLALRQRLLAGDDPWPTVPSLKAKHQVTPPPPTVRQMLHRLLEDEPTTF